MEGFRISASTLQAVTSKGDGLVVPVVVAKVGVRVIDPDRAASVSGAVGLAENE